MLTDDQRIELAAAWLRRAYSGMRAEQLARVALGQSGAGGVQTLTDALHRVDRAARQRDLPQLNGMISRLVVSTEAGGGAVRIFNRDGEVLVP